MIGRARALLVMLLLALPAASQRSAPSVIHLVDMADVPNARKDIRGFRVHFRAHIDADGSAWVDEIIWLKIRIQDKADIILVDETDKRYDKPYAEEMTKNFKIAFAKWTFQPVRERYQPISVDMEMNYERSHA